MASRVKVQAGHVWITDECRNPENPDGDAEAFDRAVARIRKTYDELSSSPVHVQGKRSVFHLCLFVEYDRE